MKELLNKITAFYKRISDVATPTIILAVICIVVTLALSSANLLTEDKIAQLQTENEQKAMAKLMEGDYEAATITIDEQVVDYHVVKKDGATIGYIFKTSVKGYGGEIAVMTALNNDASVVAIEILDASGETPGLGQNVTKESFFGQFSGLEGDIIAIKGGSANAQNNEIDAVTGATISSKAVTKAVNTAIKYVNAINESIDDGEVVLIEGDILE